MIWDFIQDEILGMKWLNRLIGSFLSLTGLDKAEFPEVLQKAMANWLVERPKFLRYARRRGREEELRKILENLRKTW